MHILEEDILEEETVHILEVEVVHILEEEVVHIPEAGEHSPGAEQHILPVGLHCILHREKENYNTVEEGGVQLASFNWVLLLFVFP